MSNLPPPLTTTSGSEFYQCVFGRFGSGNLTAISGDMYSCDVPQILPFQDEGEVYTYVLGVTANRTSISS